jgi:alkylated DNA repair dioxygenase AlkB
VSQEQQLSFQESLFEPAQASFDPSFAAIERIQLDPDSWVDIAEGWMLGSEGVFEQILKSRTWVQRERWMYDKNVLEPRLTAFWNLDSGKPLEPAVLEQMRFCLGARYGVSFDSAGFNLYRDGQDAVAWHGDKIRKEIREPVVALISLGERRRFLLRPKGAGPSRPFFLGRGDLLVTGGMTQRRWEHSVPRVARAGPRISIAFRHGMESRAYGITADSRPSPGSPLGRVPV